MNKIFTQYISYRHSLYIYPKDVYRYDSVNDAYLYKSFLINIMHYVAYNNGKQIYI